MMQRAIVRNVSHCRSIITTKKPQLPYVITSQKHYSTQDNNKEFVGYHSSKVLDWMCEKDLTMKPPVYRWSLASDEAEEMYKKYKENPELYTVEKLAREYRIFSQLAHRILCQKKDEEEEKPLEDEDESELEDESESEDDSDVEEEKKPLEDKEEVKSLEDSNSDDSDDSENESVKMSDICPEEFDDKVLLTSYKQLSKSLEEIINVHKQMKALDVSEKAFELLVNNLEALSFLKEQVISMESNQKELISEISLVEKKKHVLGMIQTVSYDDLVEIEKLIKNGKK